MIKRRLPGNCLTVDAGTLNAVVECGVKEYARPTFGGVMLYVANPKYAVYSIVCLTAKETTTTQSYIVVLARIIGPTVVIHVNNVSGFSLADDLVKAGVPREQIRLAYQGESSLISADQINDAWIETKSVSERPDEKLAHTRNRAVSECRDGGS